MGILSIGITGLRVSQLALSTTSHNIANASTPGFSRQEALLSTAMANYSAAGYIGQGSNVEQIRRVYSEFLNAEILGAETNVGALDMYLMHAKQIDNLLADSNVGLSPMLSQFFQAVQQVAADPASIPSRQSLLSSSQSLVARFQAIDQRMAEIRDGINSMLVNEVTTINAYATQIAELNERIVRATALAQGKPPNDLLDQRDYLVREMNKQVKVTSVLQSDGSMNVFIGTGQPMVIGNLNFRVLADTGSSEDPERISLRMVAPNGTPVQLPESIIQGGALGGLLHFRSEMLDPAQNALGKVALGLAMNFNQQHVMGIDLAGNFGQEYFKLPQPTVYANARNTSGARLQASIYQSDYKLDFGTGTITRLSDGTAFPIGAFPLHIDGIVIDLRSGAVGGGDVFFVKPGALPGQRVIPQSDNVGDAVFDSTGSNLQNLPTVSSDYRLTVINGGLQFVRLTDGRTWIATDLNDLQTQLDADPQGFVLSWQGGLPATLGESFLVQPTRHVVREMSVALSDPMNIAAASPFRTSTTLTNEGTGRIDVGQVLTRDPRGVPLPGRVTVTYDAAANSLTFDDGVNPPAVVTDYTPGQPNEIVLWGMRFTLSGTPADGDTFTIEPNRNGVSDNRNAIALGALQVNNTLNRGTTTIQAAYSQIVSQVGNKTREIQVSYDAQEKLAFEAEMVRQQLSGVNLDEEAANIIKFQQSYQASAKAMQIAGRLFDDILAIGR